MPATTIGVDVNRLAISLDFPLNPRNKWAREYPSGLACLGIHELDDHVPTSQIAADMADVIGLWINCGESVYAFPANPFFGSQRKMRTFLATAAECGVEHSIIMETEHLFRCPSRKSVAHLLERCECETVTLFYAATAQDAIDTVTYACDPSLDYKSPERPFMDRLTIHGGCISCAVDHAGLFAIGGTSFVLERCLKRILIIRGCSLVDAIGRT